MNTNTSISSAKQLTRDQVIKMFRQMVTIRLFEERVMDLYRRTLIPGIAHVSIGQEAVPVGVCSALGTSDYITSTHRGHGHCLAKGAEITGDVRRIIWQGHGLLPGQRWIDAYCQSGPGQFWVRMPS